jgi:hypothetical protein
MGRKLRIVLSYYGFGPQKVHDLNEAVDNG